ncbi:MAG: sensor histidine kinase [Bacteroidetes bacterium]|nr:MAG: sensor histidine kinase [Bacteroidota bacterium]
MKTDRILALKRYLRLRTSIYGQVIYVITILSVFLFVSFWVIFRSVNEEYMKNVVQQSGFNIGLLVEGALYRSMLENDKIALQSTLDIINTMPGIEDVNMYDANENLVYTSFADDTIGHNNPNCNHCHTNLNEMFPRADKSYRIIDIDSECKMSNKEASTRKLMIRSPILNQPSCYQSSCHAHAASDEVLGSLIIRLPLANLDAALSKSLRDFSILATLMTALLVFFLIIFTRRNIKRPLTAIIKASEAVTKGDRNTRLPIRSNELDDMKMVSHAFNDMLDNLQAASLELRNWSQQLEYKVQKKTEEIGEIQGELIHVERMASLGKLSLSVAHEINNPLSGILTYSKLAYKQLSNRDMDPTKIESVLKHLKLIETETKRCGDIVKGLLDFSRTDHNDFKPRHLHEILRETYDLMSHPIKIANIHFIKDFDANSDLIDCSPNQIKQACVAILVNASEAVQENGEIILRTSNPDHRHIKLEINDNGLGIAPEDIPHILEPFFTTKQGASGIGLGLSIVHGIVQSHQGHIDVRSEPGKGTSIAITLPLNGTKGEGNEPS